jgi:hypothetical protein
VSLRRALAVAALLLPLAALAQSPKWGTFELRVDNYRPNRDAEFDGTAGPYSDQFGLKRGWFPKVLVSYTLLDRFVQVDVGGGTGWFRAKGKGTNPDGTPSRDNTTFSIIPATLALTVRVDGFADRWSIPVELFGRVALERYHWLVTNGAGSITEKGATNGWSMAGGVGFLLDFVDPILARELDKDSGVNHTWLYFEVEKNVVDDFGSKTSWILSDSRLTLGGGLRMVF